MRDSKDYLLQCMLCRERFHQLKEANLEYSHAMEEMNQELGRTLPSNLSTTHDKWDALLFLYYIFLDVHLHLPIFEIGTEILSSFFVFKLFNKLISIKW